MRNHEICNIWVIRWKIFFCVRWCYGYVFKIHARLHKDTIVKQQKGRRVPIQLQDAVNKEVSRLLQEGHIVKVQEIKEDVFLQPTVITVKKDRSVKIALDARELNKNVIKDKYPMPNLDNLMDMIAEHVEQGPGETFFTTLDMTYAYGQVELSEETSRHCNFQIIGGKATGINRFVTGFYGLTTMPTEFQRIMDLTLAGITNTFVFIDDILIVTHGTEDDEIAIDFAGPFKLAPKAKKYLLVSIDHKTNWPNAAFVKKPTAETVVNFLNAHIAQFGIPKRIRTDPATIFRGETFRQLCSDHFIKHIECPIRDHRGNGKIERLVRTLNERLRVDKTIITERGNTGLARLLFALRTAAAANKTSPFEQVFGRKPNTIKEIITEKPKNRLENEETLQLSPEDFPKDDDSTIFLRDRTKNTKLEGQFKKRHGSIVAESNHTKK